MDRLELVPGAVRGAGNIMDYSPDLRVDGDVSVSGCGLTQFSSEIFGFVLDYYLMSGDGLTVKLLAPRFVSLDTVSVPVTVNVTGTCTGVVCELVSVSDGTVLFTESGTVSSGRVLFNVPVPDDVERECCWRVRVNSSGGGVTRSMGVVFIDGLSELVLTGSDDVVQLDEGIFLFASLFDGDGIGVGGVPVYFYELYEITSIDITGDKSIIQSGESVDVSAKLKDEDGSLIEGETVYFYKQYETSIYWELLEEQTQTYNDGQNVTIYSPPLSRSEIGNQWKLSFDMKTTVEGRLFIGASDYAVPTNPQNSIFMGRDMGDVISYGFRTSLTNIKSTDIATTDYHHCVIEFDNGLISYYVDDTLIGIKEIGFYENYDNYVVGAVAWTNGGGVFNVKNIIIGDLE